MAGTAPGDPGWTPTDDADQYVPDGCVVPLHTAICILALRYAEMSESSGPLATLLFYLTQRCDRPLLMTLDDLRTMLMERDLVDDRAFLDGTLDNIESPDDLIDLFMQFESCINNDTNETISRCSALGVFMREVLLAFNTLSFSAISQLFDDVLRFRAGTLPDSMCRPNMLRQFLRERATDIERSGGESSYSETERLLSELIDSKHRPPPDIHYLRFLNCMLHREFEGAISNLHLFFDLTGYRNQLAVLALALLHFHLGHIPAAHQTLRETIRIAQQNNDADCLLRALSLLAALEKETGGHSPLELRFLHGVLSSTLAANGTRAPGREPFASLDANNIIAFIQARVSGIDKSSQLWPLVDAGLACVRDAATASERDLLYAGIQLARSQVWMSFASRHLAGLTAQYAARFAPDSRLKNQAIRSLSDSDSSQGFSFHEVSSTNFQKHHSAANSEGRESCDLRDHHAAEAGPLRCQVETAIADIQRFIDGQRWREAWDLSETFLAECRRRSSNADIARTLLLQATIAEQVSSSAQFAPVVLQALYLASEAELRSLPIALECRLKLASLLLTLDAPEVALRMLKQSLPDILEQLSSDFKAQAFLILAKSSLRIWRNTSSDDKTKRDAALKQSIHYLNEARSYCSGSPTLTTEIWYLLSHCWNCARRFDKRDRCAEEFLRCQQLSVD